MLPQYWVPVFHMHPAPVHVPVPMMAYATGTAVPSVISDTGSSANSYSLCCGSVQSHRGIATHWEKQVDAFLDWLAHNGRREVEDSEAGFAFVVRLTTLVNGRRTCGAMEYAAIQSGTAGGQVRYRFRRVANDFSKEHGFTDLCAFKNYCCDTHGLFVKLDVFRPTV
ncbi:hypothetical protein AURDEDRAFT_164055 [Auricularia subglabra TFB-10046 SS5]|nr:hypothetical protein AURDEDRAFT_164055 [Auricularia subglabra TFB-10046 SS5]